MSGPKQNQIKVEEIQKQNKQVEMAETITTEQVSAMREAARCLLKIHQIPTGEDVLNTYEEHNACVHLFNAFRNEGQKLIRNVYDMIDDICKKHSLSWRVEMARKCFLFQVREPEDADDTHQWDAHFAQLVVLGILLGMDAPDIDCDEDDMNPYIETIIEFRDELMSEFN